MAFLVCWNPKIHRQKYPCGCLTPVPCFCSELDDLHSGAIRKGTLPDSRPEGDAQPQDGDLVSSYIHCISWESQHAYIFLYSFIYMRHVRCLEVLVAIISSPVQVFFHLTVRREDERVLETTRLSEDGVEGSGVPKAFMLGKGQRMPRGWELALYGGPLLPQCLCNCTAMACHMLAIYQCMPISAISTALWRPPA